MLLCVNVGVKPWLLEHEIGRTVIKTDKLKAFLARRRWQRCGQVSLTSTTPALYLLYRLSGP